MTETPSSPPFVDEHSREVAAPAPDTWRAVDAVARRAFSGPVKHAVARALGATVTDLAGFRVASSRPPEALVLAGRHRFSAYELGFRVEALPGGRSLVRAETRAAFPGLAGRAYRAAVIGTGGHVVVVRNLLAAIAARAERES